jgi:hypothetical protein
MQIRSLSLVVACSFVAACGGGGTTSSGSQAPTQDVPTPATETPAIESTDILTAPAASSDTVDPDASKKDTTAVPATTTPSDDGTPSSTDKTTVSTSGTGTSDGDTTTPAVTPPAPVIPPVPLTFFSFDTASSVISTGSGQLEQLSDRITLSGLSGTISADGSMVILDGGGQITLVASDTDYVGLYQAEPTSGNPSFGVYGQATDFATFSPSGAATYTGLGTAIVQIIDGSDIYDLIGNVAADVDFDTALVDVAISDLQGQRTDGLSTPVQVLDAAQLGVTGGRLSNGTFSGGSASFTSSEIATRLSGAQAVTSSGGLYGDAGDEIGGVFVIDDTTGTGNLLIQGHYIGD